MLPKKHSLGSIPGLGTKTLQVTCYRPKKKKKMWKVDGEYSYADKLEAFKKFFLIREEKKCQLWINILIHSITKKTSDVEKLPVPKRKGRRDKLGVWINTYRPCIKQRSNKDL